MTLRRAAFPHRDGSRIYDVYLLWLEAHDILGDGGPRPVASEHLHELEEIIQDQPFQEALSQLPSEAKVEIAPSALDRYYVRILTPSVGKAAKHSVISLPLPPTSAPASP